MMHSRIASLGNQLIFGARRAQTRSLATGQKMARTSNMFFSTKSFSTVGGPIVANKFHVGITMNPHPAKRDKGGEDAATVTENVIAIADGVGGWAESGIDPAKYSRQLCKNIQALLAYDGGARYMCNPRLLCVEAAEQATETGSSTCVIASLDKEAPVLYTSNLGDSGYLLVRKSGSDLVSVFRSEEQTHGFNFPYQIGTGGDDPQKADTQVHNIAHNDILIVGSDGLFDNMFDDKIMEIIWPFVRGQDDIDDPQVIADVIAQETEHYSRQQNYVSPFAKNAKSHHYDFMGGKQDDITVAVAQIKLAKGDKTETTTKTQE